MVIVIPFLGEWVAKNIEGLFAKDPKFKGPFSILLKKIMKTNSCVCAGLCTPTCVCVLSFVKKIVLLERKDEEEEKGE